MMIEDYTCTCGGSGGDPTDHTLACALWDDEDFVKGYAYWSDEDQELIYLQPMTSLHDVLGEAVPEDLPDDDKQWEAPTETAFESYGEACTRMEEELIKDWVEGAVPKNYTLDGTSRVWNPEEGAWETLEMNCYCKDGPDSGPNLCLHCQVWRPGKAAAQKAGKSVYGADHWRPLFVGEAELLCSCDPPMNYQCEKCGVKRNHPREPWGSYTVKHGGATNSTSYVKYVACRHPGRPLVYPDGTTLYGSSHSGEIPKDFKPDFAIYLDKCWTAKTLAIQVPWPDMQVPALEDEHIIALVDLIGRMIDKGQTVEVGCIGGHGRTGTLLAMVALHHGVETPEEAVEYVRKNYCEKAIETDMQEWYVKKYHCVINDLEIPEKPKVKWNSGNGTAQGARKGSTTIKKLDGQGVWYCGLCAKDAWDQDHRCWWCEADFSNPGVRPIAEWDNDWCKKFPADVKSRIAKATLLEAEDSTNTSTAQVIKIVNHQISGGRVDSDGYTHVKECKCEDCKDAAIDRALDSLSTGGQPHVQSRLPFQTGEQKTLKLLGQMRLLQPIGTLTTFRQKGRTFIPTDFKCERCKRRLYYKVRWTDPKSCMPFRQELVHADDLTKVTRCKGGKK